MAKLRDIVNGIFSRNNRFFRGYGVSLGGFKLSEHQFAETVYYNIIGMLTDLDNDVTWKFGNKNLSLSAAFVAFYNKYAKLFHTRYFDKGYVVIAHEWMGEGSTRVDSLRFAKDTEYRVERKDEYVYILPTKKAKDEGLDMIVIASPLLECTGHSHKEQARPYLCYLDNALNASNTITSRLGAMVVASPKGTVNTFGRLNEEEKKEIEAEIRKDYGALSTQSQFLLLPKEMDMQVVSLANLDLKTDMRVRASVLALADLFRVPANQIAMIDADSSKALSNGSELIAGDLAKYKSFERLLEETFVQLARDLGLKPSKYEEIDGVSTAIYYGIYNKPVYNNEEGNANA